LESMSDDIETMMGKQLTLNNLLQYAGGQLSREDVGKIVKNMPFANADEILSDLTLDYESANNIILALDRGDVPPVKPKLNKEYVLRRLTARQLESDYDTLSPEIQSNYDEYIRLLEAILADEIEKLRMAQSDLIPAQGFLITCDIYTQDPANPAKTK